MASIYPPDQPWTNNWERLQTEALRRAFAYTNEELRHLKPPLPQVHDRPRFGYRPYAHQPTLDDVIGLMHNPSDLGSEGRNSWDMYAGFNSGSARYELEPGT